MKKLSKEKRNQLILVFLLVGGVLAGLWFGLIEVQRKTLANLASDRAGVDRRLRQVTETISGADQVEDQLAEQGERLEKVEIEMATGDLYSWAIDTVRRFKLPYKIDIPQFSQIDGPKGMNMLAGFPYKQASITISGTAAFHEFGKFIADFENQFPYMRVVNLTLEPASGQTGDNERLAFRMEIAALVKPTSS